MLAVSPAFAEVVAFTKEYTYQASEFDSKASSRTIAIEQVKRLLLEELGTYLEGQTEVRNFEMSKDKITALTAGIVKAEIIDEKWDGKNYWLKAVVKADPVSVARSLDDLRKNKSKMADMEEVQAKQDAALKEIERLKSEMASLKKDIKDQERFNRSIAVLDRGGGPNQSLSSSRIGQVPPAQKRPDPCKEDVREFCSDVTRGGGKIVKCLKEHRQELSQACRNALEHGMKPRRTEAA